MRIIGSRGCLSLQSSRDIFVESGCFLSLTQRDKQADKPRRAKTAYTTHPGSSRDKNCMDEARTANHSAAFLNDGPGAISRQWGSGKSRLERPEIRICWPLRHPTMPFSPRERERERVVSQVAPCVLPPPNRDASRQTLPEREGRSVLLTLPTEPVKELCDTPDLRAGHGV